MRQIYNELKKIRSDTKCQKSSEANITKDTIQSTNDYNFSAPGLVVIYSSRYSKALVIYPMSFMKKKKKWFDSVSRSNVFIKTQDIQLKIFPHFRLLLHDLIEF